MLVTLITDAGWCPHKRIGVYAAWYRDTQTIYRKSGVMRGECLQSEHAEMAAIANGLHMVFSTFRHNQPLTVVAQSDCLGAVNLLQRGTRTSDPRHRYIQSVTTMIAAAKATVIYRHVKGHVATADREKRHMVNVWCDQECTRLLRQARRDLQTPETPQPAQV